MGLGRDPFALTPEKLRLFQGYDGANDLNSLFDGQRMKENGLFTQTGRQLGGAAPLTAPVVDNEEEVDRSGPTFIVITSEYSPAGGDLTQASEITMNVTLRNAGENLAEGIKFYACLQDDYIILLEEPAPEPPFTNDPWTEVEEATSSATPEDTPPGGVPIEPETPDALPDDEDEDTPEGSESARLIQDDTVYNCFMRLEWESIDGEPIDLEPGEEVTFSWTFQPKSDDIVIRWRMWAEYGAGASYLRHWIPIKNPNPTGQPTPGGANGVPVSCTDSTANNSMPFPENQNNQQIIDQINGRWAIELRPDDYNWADAQYKPLLKVLWDTLSAVECTPFLTEMKNKNGGRMVMYATALGGYWGNYGLSHSGALAINIPPLLDTINSGAPAKVTWLFIHEMGHAYSNDRDGMPEYYAEYMRIYNQHGPFTAYGYTDHNENFADVLGYYVGRCASEEGGPNPYSGSGSAVTDYYEYTKTYIFGGQEFGPTPPGATSC